MVTSTGNAPEKKISSAFIYFFGSFGGILFGYDIGVMTGALPFLQNDWSLQGNASIIGWITSAVMFGAIFGGAMAGQLSDRLGRRKMILISAIIFVIGSILSGIAPHDGEYYLIGVRILLGLAVGAASALVPAYMSEMAPAHLRGRLSGINQTMIVSGMLLSYVVDFLLKDLPETMAWRLMLGLAAVPAIILFLGVLRLPESPRFLVKHGLVDEARRVLGYIRNTKDEVEAELADIKNMTATEANLKEPSLATLFSDKYRYLVTAGVGVAAFQQFQGANAIFYYIPLIVEKATGQAASSQLMWPIIQGVLLVLGSLIFLVIADKFNRRTLLTVGGTIMGLSFILPAVINSIIPNADPMMIVFFLCIYVAFYSFTWAPLTWVIVGEIFPLAIRGRAAGLASSFNWIGSFLVGLLFPIMTASLSQATVFAIFGVICMLGVCFIRNCVPETRGHTLEEIEAAGTKKSANASVHND
ncbi:MAG: sugar porter family MFS transporter [Mitsuokella jalaludinii]|uniref:sugar porter family MFS transporter n=1 Tax=Mitsuokella jalaludinii TaxID=187979 RepID=UPI00243110E9|nr:sugar porter family MFS transporter [Mitsuokella jalaludinii]MCI6606502.1 sugar porter family MFS transporter [Mitsuokella jalaludinii]MCI6612061.1 sugar porter family MFS transporter [Mitsuokella jalaludinii]MCI7064025.1 sugar porter family MFS transporter [Mitsuokella jalaludinii]MCI7186140.1 sugar porter family MFS transporter [Mitsuokella jalaludinii]MCI7717103.1 sugar porter family MFS transporter [Mitsuokella jalaludinii]